MITVYNPTTAYTVYVFDLGTGKLIGLALPYSKIDFELPIAGYSVNAVLISDHSLVYSENGSMDWRAYVLDSTPVFDEGTMGNSFTGTITVPGLGVVTPPSWAYNNPEMAVFFMGFAAGAGILLVRHALRWFKRADGAGHGGEE